MRSYQQYCALARALDVIGDRWTLLIVRELLISDARYSDLLKGLPGIATNLLATRLNELEAAGLVRREVVPPPTAATVFRLTPHGAALRSVIYELGRWAAPLMTPPGPGEHMRARWIALPIEMYLRDRTPKAKPVAVQIDGGDEPIVIETKDGEIRAWTGTVPRPDVFIIGSPALALALLLGKVSMTDAKRQGIKFKGNVRVLDRLRMSPRSIRVCPMTRPGTRGGSAAVQARTRHREAGDEGNRGDGPGCGNGRDDAGGAARAAGSDKRRRRAGSSVGIRPD